MWFDTHSSCRIHSYLQKAYSCSLVGNISSSLCASRPTGNNTTTKQITATDCTGRSVAREFDIHWRSSSLIYGHSGETRDTLVGKLQLETRNPKVTEQSSRQKEETTESMPYACLVCGKNFAHSASVFRHQKRFHSAEKSFLCEKCGKGYGCRTDVNAHKKLCNVGTKFLCPVTDCSRTFSSVTSQKRHFRKHTGTLPYTCTLCKKNRQFQDGKGLQRHLKRHYKFSKVSPNDIPEFD